jgi:hypothetical protein
MAGAGRLRSDWNQCLLEQVLPPLYARLLSEARHTVDCTIFHSLWPTAGTSAPWSLLVRALYARLATLPVLRSQVRSCFQPVGFDTRRCFRAETCDYDILRQPGSKRVACSFREPIASHTESVGDVWCRWEAGHG